GLTDHGEAVVDEEVAADLRAGMDVDRGQPAAEMIDQAGEEVELAFEQPVGEAVEAERPDARVEQDFGTRARRGVASADRVQIGGEPIEHVPDSPLIRPL